MDNLRRRRVSPLKAYVLSISQRRLAEQLARKPDPWRATTALETDGDTYRGTKKQLIDAGICRPEWFPNRRERQVRKNGLPYMGNNGKQRCRRDYPVTGQRSEILLRMVGRDQRGVLLWTAWIAVNDKERARRRAKAEREELERREGELARRQAEEHRVLAKIDRERQEENAEMDRVLPSIIARLPALGEPTSAEVDHLRVLRALPDHAGMLLDMALAILFKAKQGNELPARRHLRLVVDRDAAPR